MSFYRALAPWAQTTLLVLLLLAGLAWVLHYVTLVHERRQVEQRVCAAQLEAVRARNPVMRNWIAAADPCVSVRAVAR